MTNNHTKTIARITSAILALAFLLPLITAPGLLAMPYVTSKVFFFRSVVLLALAGYGILLALRWDEFRPRVSKLGVAILVWSAILVVATFASTDVHRSWWADHDRMMGVFTVLHYTLFFFIARALWRDEQTWTWMLRIFFAVGFIVCGIALLEQFSFVFSARSGARISSTIGNAVPFSLFAGFLGVAGAHLFFRMRDAWRYFFGAVVILGILTAILSETRGTILALVIIGLIALARKMRYGAITVLAFVIIIGGLGVFVPAARNVMMRVPVIERFADPAQFAGGTATRLAAWRYAWQGFLARPILGWGPMNYFYVFNTYYEPELVQFGLQETWFDVAHNMFFETLATTGAIGFLAYLALFVVAAREVLRTRNWMLGSLLVLYAVYAFFEIDDPVGYFLFMFLLLAIDREAGPWRESTRVAAPSKIHYVVPVMALALLWYTSIVPARAAYYAERGDVKLKETHDAAAWFFSYERALSLDTPYKNSMRIAMARTLARMEISPEARTSPGVAEAFRFTLLELEKSEKKHPRNPFFLTQSGDVLVRKYELFGTPDAIPEAIALYKKALEVAPRRQQIYSVIEDALKKIRL